jgi:hypothetical protein
VRFDTAGYGAKGDKVSMYRRFRSAPPVPRVTLACVAALAVLPAPRASALDAEGERITTSDYTIDFYQGPILESTRSIGLAGSYSPLAEGVIGYPVNPASVARRLPWSTSWFDWELDGGITLPGSVRNTDFDNNGDETFGTKAAFFLTGGVGIQLGEFGIGLQFAGNNYETTALDGESAVATLGVTFLNINLVTGFSALDGQLAFGAGIGAQSIELSDPNDGDRTLSDVVGSTVQVGAVWSPIVAPIRAGVALRVSLPSDDVVPSNVMPDEQGNYVAAGYYLPSKIVVPTEIHFGLATQLFRPLNFRWQNPRRRPRVAPAKPELSYKELPRRRLLLSTALKVTWPVKNAIGTESFVNQVVERSGTEPSFSPRIGVEGEPWINWLVLRGGSYYEPTRFKKSSARVHGTLGTDIHVPLVWSVFGLLEDDTSFRIGGALDVAERYFGWSANVGVWR